VIAVALLAAAALGGGAQGVLALGTPAPVFAGVEFAAREPTELEVQLASMGWLPAARWEASLDVSTGHATLVHGLGDGAEPARSTDLARAAGWAELDRGLRVLGLATEGADLGSVAARDRFVHPLAIAPEDHPWADATEAGRLTLVSRTGLVVWSGLDAEEATLKALIALRWPPAPRVQRPPAPLLDEAWARYHDGQWSDSRRLAAALGATADPTVTGGDQLAALIDAHEQELLRQVESLPATPQLHELARALRLREALTRGFPGGPATRALLGWTSELRRREGMSEAMRTAADWVALEPRRPLGWPLLGGVTPVDAAVGAVIERAGDEPLGAYARALLALR
jgi:hypothetical protein